MFVTHDDLIAVFEDTEEWYQNDETLKEAITQSIKGTELYMEGELPEIEAGKSTEKTVITVGKHRTFETAQYYKRKNPELKVGVLNFASATNPGGGVTSGSRAQEEALCRCSTLYPTLATDDLWKKYYKFHRDRHNALYTDACIYTPDVLVIKSDTDKPQRLPKDKWIKVDVLTCAAPNLRPRPNNKYNPEAGKHIDVSDEELFTLHVNRAKQILTVAVLNGIDVLILGAFGCGAFQNDPNVVAKAYAEVIPQFNGYFKEITFAIYCSPKKGNDNYIAFARVFKK